MVLDPQIVCAVTPGRRKVDSVAHYIHQISGLAQSNPSLAAARTAIVDAFLEVA